MSWERTGYPRAKAPSAIVAGVALVAAGMLILELLATRFFSALFYYHYSFFAISIVMAGLTLGALLCAKMLREQDPEPVLAAHLGKVCLVFSGATALATLFFVYYSHLILDRLPQWWEIALLASAYLPALTACGYYLAAVFSLYKRDISRLYGIDLVAAAAGVSAAVWIMRIWQGPVSAFLPAALGALAAVLLCSEKSRIVAWAWAAPLIAVLVVAPFLPRPMLRLPPGHTALTGVPKDSIVLERWNEHSRVLGHQVGEYPVTLLYIDKEALTLIIELPLRGESEPPPVPDWAKQDIFGLAYHLERPVERVAVIGVGGGRDIISAIAGGATEVDGYELNRTFLRLLAGEYYDYSGGLVDWPGVNMIHDEGRVGIVTSGKTYDVIVASMTDTWAATAHGGFVLSENSIYTVDGWQDFLERISDHGLIMMSRWYLPAEPVEMQRLVTTAAEALERIGVENPAEHVIVAAAASEEELQTDDKGVHLTATVIASPMPFSPEDVERLIATTQTWDSDVSLLHPRPDDPASLRMVLDRETREGFLRASEFNIRPATDENPYFFLMVRPWDLPTVFRSDVSGVREITYNGVRVLVVMTALTVVFAGLILIIALFGWKRPERTEHRWLELRLGGYFFLIGLGYMLVQLGLLQRLIVILGHPTYAFTVILFTMLLATGIGSFCSSLVRRHQIIPVLAAVLAGVLLLTILHPFVGALSHFENYYIRIAACGSLPTVAGALLGFCLPLGYRLANPLPEGTVIRLWAINGAAGVAGSSVAAYLGVIGGSQLVLSVGAVCYALLLAISWVSFGLYRQLDEEKMPETAPALESQS